MSPDGQGSHSPTSWAGEEERWQSTEDATYSTFELCFQLAVHVQPRQQKIKAAASQADLLWGAVGIHTRELAVSTTTRLNTSGEMVSKSALMMPANASIIISVSDDGNFWLGTSSYAWNVDISSITLQLAFSSLQLAKFFSGVYSTAIRENQAQHESNAVMLIDPEADRCALLLQAEAPVCAPACSGVARLLNTWPHPPTHV
jgi:hypothetical protein